MRNRLGYTVQWRSKYTVAVLRVRKYSGITLNQSTCSAEQALKPAHVLTLLVLQENTLLKCAIFKKSETAQQAIF
jgi:hypothetical protein